MAQSRDPYEVLGVARDATQADIKAAYRRLAKELHPDVNPNDSIIEQKFKEVGAAYDLLSNADKRARYDRGEIDADGNRRRRSPGGARSRSTGAGPHTHTRYDRQRRGYYEARHSRRTGNQDETRTRAATGARTTAGTRTGNAEREHPEAHRETADDTAKGTGAEARRDFRHGGADDLFSDIFGDQHHRRSTYERGADITYSLRISFAEAAAGAKKRVTLANGRYLDIEIPAGAEDGQTLRLEGQGMPGLGGAPNGNAYVDLKVDAHPYFVRDDIDIYLDLPVTLDEAVNGAQVQIPTIDGYVRLNIPAGSNSGDTLRLKGKGTVDRRSNIRGCQYVRLKIVLPADTDSEMAQFLKQWYARHPDDPRQRYGIT